MTEIRVNNQSLDLYPNTRIPVNFFSPIFDRDAIQRSFTYPFKIPATVNNKKLLQYPTRIDGTGKRKYDFSEFRIAGQQYEQGTIVITKSNDVRIEIVFRNEILELIENLKNFRIREDLSIPIQATQGFFPPFQIRLDLDAVDESARIVPMAVNGNYYSKVAEFADEFVDDINADFPFLTSIVANSGSEIIIQFNPAVKPDLELVLFPLSQIPNDQVFLVSEYFRYYETSSNFEQDYLEEYARYVEDVKNGVVDTHTFPIVYAPNFYDKENEAWKGYLNHTSPNGNLSYSLRNLDEQAEYNLVPMPFLQTIFEAIFVQAGPVSISGSFFEDPYLANLLVYNNRSIETTITDAAFIKDKYSIPNLDEKIFIAYLSTYYLQEHCPDLTFYEFIQKVGTMFPIVYSLRGGTIQINTVSQLLNKAINDLSDYTLEDWDKKHTKFSGYSLSYERYDTPEEDPQYLMNIDGGTKEDKTLPLKSEFFTHYFRDVADLTTADLNGLAERAFRVPIDPFEGFSLPGNASSEIDLRLLFYFGKQLDSQGNEYAYASFLPEDIQGQSVGPYSLEWDGEKGLYQQHWREYIDLLTADEVSVQLLLPIQKIFELKQNITTAVYIRHKDGSFRGLIKQFSFTVNLKTGNQILCKATIAKL